MNSTKYSLLMHDAKECIVIVSTLRVMCSVDELSGFKSTFPDWPSTQPRQTLHPVLQIDGHKCLYFLCDAVRGKLMQISSPQHLLFILAFLCATNRCSRWLPGSIRRRALFLKKRCPPRFDTRLMGDRLRLQSITLHIVCGCIPK